MDQGPARIGCRSGRLAAGSNRRIHFQQPWRAQDSGTNGRQRRVRRQALALHTAWPTTPRGGMAFWRFLTSSPTPCCCLWRPWTSASYPAAAGKVCWERAGQQGFPRKLSRSPQGRSNALRGVPGRWCCRGKSPSAAGACAWARLPAWRGRSGVTATFPHTICSACPIPPATQSAAACHAGLRPVAARV